MGRHPYSAEPDLSFLRSARGAYAHRARLMTERDNFWNVNNSDIKDYSERARDMGRVGGLTAVIVEQIGREESNAGLDIAAGSNAEALTDLLDAGVLGTALATNYSDRRSKSVRSDARLGHVKGGLTRRKTWNHIIGWKNEHAPDGFALVMHRPVGGLQQLPAETYKGVAHLLLDMLRPEGLMFTQIPRSLTAKRAEYVEICEGIKARADIDDIVWAPHPSHAAYHGLDWSDHYVVITKS